MQAYADYNDLMDLTEQLISEMVLEVNNGSYVVSYHPEGPDSEAVDINFKPPWRRISMVSGLEEALGVTFPQDLASEEAREFLAKLVSHQIRCLSHKCCLSVAGQRSAAWTAMLAANPAFAFLHFSPSL